MNLQRHKEKNAKEILKAEIGTLLFNLGKTHVGFWNKKMRKKDGDRPYFQVDDFFDKYGYSVFDDYKEYLNTASIDLSPFEKDVANVGANILTLFMETNIEIKLENSEAKSIENLKLKNVINGDGKAFKHDFVSKVMFRGCENVNSGIDKGAPKEQLSHLNIVNAFGSVMETIDDTEDGKRRYDERRLDFFKRLRSKKSISNKDFIQIREDIQSEIKKWYSHLLSDSRFPINDVTLWDQAYMTASMFKAALAAISLDGLIYDRYILNPRKIMWSIMGIQYDKLGLAEKAMNSYFINWYRETAKKADKKIKKLIEVEYALGNEIYRDETGIYFIVPENVIGKHAGRGAEKLYYLHDDLNELQNDIVKCFEEFKGEVFPAIFLTKPSRGTMNIAFLLKNVKKNFLKPIYPQTFDMKEIFNVKIREESHIICDVCRVRFVGVENNNLKLCHVCNDRRTKTKHEEVKIDRKIKETVFTGEVQDKNGMIALVTLKFELSEWLNGNMLNMMLSNKNIENSVEKLISNIKADLGCRKGNSVIKDLVFEGDLPSMGAQEYCKSILVERTIGDEWEELLKRELGDKINFEDRIIKWNDLSDSNIKFLAEILIQFLIRKNPSPARFRRIWESTEAFFTNIEKELGNIFKMPAYRNRRIKFNKIIDEQHKNKEFEYKGLNFTSDMYGNLYLISSIEHAVPLLKNHSIENKIAFEEIEKDKSDWINKNKIELTDMENGSKYSVELKNIKYISYKPYISIIDTTPISWQFIVPAEYVPKVIQEVQRRYNEQFKYVKGKLPLHIGMVFQNYKKPLYIGIKALRNIRRDIYTWDNIKCKKTGKALKEDIGVSGREKLNREYYSIFQLSDTSNKDNHKYYRIHLPKSSEEIFLKNVDEATDKEKYYIYPNTIDFEFLDTNIRRNDISYNYEKGGIGAKRIAEKNRCKPYTWDEWQSYVKFREYFITEVESKEKDEVEKKMLQKNNAKKLQSTVSLIYSKLNDWRGVENQAGLVKFICSAFINTFELKDNKKKNEFAQILGASGWNDLRRKSTDEFINELYKFLDMYDFWHNCLRKI